MSAIDGESLAGQIVRQNSELAQLRAENERLNDLLKTHKVLETFKSYEKCAAENERLRAEMDALNQTVTDQKWFLARRRDDLARHKQLLVEAKEALERAERMLSIWDGNKLDGPLAHINQALDPKPNLNLPGDSHKAEDGQVPTPP